MNFPVPKPNNNYEVKVLLGLTIGILIFGLAVTLLTVMK